MSTALVDRQVRKHLGGLTAQERATLGAGEAQLSPAEQHALHTAYSHAFHDGMVAAVVISGATVLLMLGAYRRGSRKLVRDQRQALEQQEMERRRAAAAEKHAAENSAAQAPINQEPSVKEASLA